MRWERGHIFGSGVGMAYGDIMLSPFHSLVNSSTVCVTFSVCTYQALCSLAMNIMVCANEQSLQ